MPSPSRRSNSKGNPDASVPEVKPVSAQAKILNLSKIDAVRRRIANGYYDRDEVRDRLAHAVLEELRED